MAAMYQVRFDNGDSLYIHAADAKSMKKPDIRASYKNARRRAEARHLKKTGKKVRAVECRCVG